MSLLHKPIIKWIMKVVFLFALISYCLLLNCCQSVKPLFPCESSPKHKVIMTYDNAIATLRQDPSSKQFYLLITKCNCQIIHSFPKGLTAPASPCNLPIKYQKDGLAIAFSGQLRIDTTYNYEAIDISGVPLELTKIQLAE